MLAWGKASRKREVRRKAAAKLKAAVAKISNAKKVGKGKGKQKKAVKKAGKKAGVLAKTKE